MSALEAQEAMKQKLADMKARRLERSNTATGIPESSLDRMGSASAPASPSGTSVRTGSPNRGGLRGPAAAAGARGGSSPRGGARGSSPMRGGEASPRGSVRGAPARGGANAAAGGALRELNLVKAELKVLQMKYDSEVKRRESLENQVSDLKANAALQQPGGRMTMMQYAPFTPLYCP